MLHGTLSRRMVVGVLAIMLLVPLLGAGTVSAESTTPPQPDGIPTSIDASPQQQNVYGDSLGNATANWTLYLSGGNETSYYVTADWGTGQSQSFWVYGTTKRVSHMYNYTCGHLYSWQQHWYASSTGGGTATDASWVYFLGCR